MITVARPAPHRVRARPPARLGALALLAAGAGSSRWGCLASTRRWPWTSLCWALFAVAVDLLLGYTGLLSFGHAAFWGSVRVRRRAGRDPRRVPFPVAVLAGALLAAALAVPIGYLCGRAAPASTSRW